MSTSDLAAPRPVGEVALLRQATTVPNFATIPESYLIEATLWHRGISNSPANVARYGAHLDDLAADGLLERVDDGLAGPKIRLTVAGRDLAYL